MIHRDGFGVEVRWRNAEADEHAGRRLARAIQGKGAFGRFKDELHEEHPDLLPAWYAFRDTRARRRADRDQADLVSTVAHEIRSPLTTVKGFTSTLITKWDRLADRVFDREGTTIWRVGQRRS